LQIYVKSGQDAEHMVEAATELAITVRPVPTSRHALIGSAPPVSTPAS
jgi:hypothetical protein